jgi:hypothetical protein
MVTTKIHNSTLIRLIFGTHTLEYRLNLIFLASSYLDRKESVVVAFHQTLRGFMFFTT